jgi:hypothetical protein
MRPITSLVAVASLALPAGAQQASLTYRLGKDTVAVEQFTRTSDRMTGEMVQRSGAAVTMVRYDVRLSGGRPQSATISRVAADGSLLPNQPSETRFRFTADSVVREIVRSDSVERRAFAARHAMLAFPVFVYGPMELLAAMRGAGADSAPALGMGGNVGMLGLVPAGGDTLRMRGGPYPMRLVFDGSGRLQAVDGSMTTNKIMATRGGAVDVAAIARTMKPTGTLSSRDVARGAFGAGGIVIVDYSRPMVRERTVWGGALVPYDSIWRAGANDATHLFTTRNLTFGDVTVPAGTYTLWIQHTRTGTFLIVNRQTGQWGTQYDPTQDLARIPMQLAPAADHVEELTVGVRNNGGNRGTIEFAWGPSVVSASFTATAR